MPWKRMLIQQKSATRLKFYGRFTVHIGPNTYLEAFCRKVFRIGTVRYNWPMSVHASQAFSIVTCTDSGDLPFCLGNVPRRGRQVFKRPTLS